MALGNYIDLYERTHSKHGEESDLIRVTIKGLAAIAAEHGEDSVQYKTAQQILKQFLQTVIEALSMNSSTGFMSCFKQETT